MAVCPRCRHDDNDEKVSNRICKSCLRSLALGTQPKGLDSINKITSLSR